MHPLNAHRDQGQISAGWVVATFIDRCDDARRRYPLAYSPHTTPTVLTWPGLQQIGAGSQQFPLVQEAHADLEVILPFVGSDHCFDFVWLAVADPDRPGNIVEPYGLITPHSGIERLKVISGIESSNLASPTCATFNGYFDNVAEAYARPCRCPLLRSRPNMAFNHAPFGR